MLALLAQATNPGPAVTVGFDWKQLLPVFAAGGPILTLVAGVTYWLAGRKFRDQVRSLRDQLGNMTGAKDLAEDKFKNEQAKSAALSATVVDQATQIKNKDAALADLTAKYDRVYKAGYDQHGKLEALRTRHANLTAEHAAEKAAYALTAANLAVATGDLQSSTAELSDLRADQKRLDKRLKRIQKLQGYLTSEKALQKVPKFRPLSERRRPIMSVLNLKGGVGKTTVTAHLGAALARKGYRVLLVDLDLQGSLSALMLPQGTITGQGKAKRLVQDFFRIAAGKVLTKLSPFTVPVPDQPADCPGSLSIVPTTDGLAYSELSLTLGWLLKRGTRDARFLLRKALHFKVDNSEYDVVLLDCPPLLSISCVNALAASDYLLTPTLLSAKASERVPVLLRTLDQPDFKKHVNSQLKVMGVLASRANRTPPAGNEGRIWQDLPKFLDTVHMGQVRLFDTVIGQDAKISAGEERFVHPESGTRAEAMFDELATEVEKELPSDCRKAPPPTA